MNYEKLTLFDATTRLIEKALERTGNHKKSAAHELGVTPQTLSSLLRTRKLTEKYRKNKSKINPEFKR